MDRRTQQANEQINPNISEQKIKETLKIGAINTDFIVRYQRRMDLGQFVKQNNLDIALVYEIKLTKRHKLIIEGYNIIRTDKPNAMKDGGTAILIKKRPFGS